MSVIWIRLRSEQSTIIAWHNKKTIGKSARVEGGSYRFTSHNLHHFLPCIQERGCHMLYIWEYTNENTWDISRRFTLLRASKIFQGTKPRGSASELLCNRAAGTCFETR
jgi:hypothetical protein